MGSSDTGSDKKPVISFFSVIVQNDLGIDRHSAYILLMFQSDIGSDKKK
jgi:hypothetical protein